jgi:hypothetical protein
MSRHQRIPLEPLEYFLGGNDKRVRRFYRPFVKSTLYLNKLLMNLLLLLFAKNEIYSLGYFLLLLAPAIGTF